MENQDILDSLLGLELEKDSLLQFLKDIFCSKQVNNFSGSLEDTLIAVIMKLFTLIKCNKKRIRQ